ASWSPQATRTAGFVSGKSFRARFAENSPATPAAFARLHCSRTKPACFPVARTARFSFGSWPAPQSRNRVLLWMPQRKKKNGMPAGRPWRGGRGDSSPGMDKFGAARVWGLKSPDPRLEPLFTIKQRLTALLLELESEKFNVRQRVSEEMEKLGELTIPFL